jgi:hypothetical protein
MPENDESDDKRRERSPSFPFIPLAKAIERARAMAEAHKRSPARIGAVGETWGYAPKSSGLLQTASALKAFGLLEDVGRGLDRKLQLSELAWRILRDTRPNAKEQAIKEAALRPKMIAEYVPHWVPDRPSDSHCISELHLDRGFNTTSAELFLSVFDDTVTFANLKSPDKFSEMAIETFASLASSDHSTVLEGRSLMRPPLGQEPRPKEQAVEAASPRATLPLPEGLAAIEIPRYLSKKSYTALKAWVDVMITLADPGDDPHSEIKAANQYDIPGRQS